MKMRKKSSLISIIWSCLSTNTESMGSFSSRHNSHINKNGNGFYKQQFEVVGEQVLAIGCVAEHHTVTYMRIRAAKVVLGSSINNTNLWHIFWLDFFLLRFTVSGIETLFGIYSKFNSFVWGFCRSSNSQTSKWHLVCWQIIDLETGKRSKPPQMECPVSAFVWDVFLFFIAETTNHIFCEIAHVSRKCQEN